MLQLLSTLILEAGGEIRFGLSQVRKYTDLRVYFDNSTEEYVAQSRPLTWPSTDGQPDAASERTA